MIFSPSTTPSLLAAVALSTALTAMTAATTAAHAQTAAPQADKSNTATLPYLSAFEAYQPYADAPVSNWKAANDTTAQIGGWREYAKQAQSGVSTSAGPVVPETKPALKAVP